MTTLRIIIIALLILVAVPAVAQDDVPAVPDDPGLQTLLAMAASVAAFIEWLKTSVLSKVGDELKWSDRRYAAVVQTCAIVVSFGLVFMTENTVNVFDVLGITIRAPLWVAQAVTALTISFGNILLFSLYELFRGVRPKVLEGTVVPKRVVDPDTPNTR